MKRSSVVHGHESQQWLEHDTCTWVGRIDDAADANVGFEVWQQRYRFSEVPVLSSKAASVLHYECSVTFVEAR